jgi:hypothetical protein
MSSHRYYSDDDHDAEDYELQKEYDLIKQFKLEDYLECPETYKIIDNEWNCRVEDTLETKLNDVFMKYHEYFKDLPEGFFSRSSHIHCVDLFMLVKHHLVRNYSIDMFKENPSLAKPLVNSIQDIKQMRLARNKEQLKHRFNVSNKEFSWGK